MAKLKVEWDMHNAIDGSISKLKSLYGQVEKAGGSKKLLEKITLAKRKCYEISDILTDG